ncbi:MAG: cytochrome c3 family protein [Candidatus Methanoperedens sp.]|nr:cytochrome c3 family protein [Candidatus Methanoperedens sp.]
MHHKSFILSGLILLFAIFAVPGVLADNSCINCHEKLSAFNETEQQFNQIRIKHLARDVPCSLECHATTLSKFAKSNYEQWTKSKHAMFNITCDNCHGGNPGSDVKEKAHAGVLLDSDPNSSVFYRNVPETCGKCHTEELSNFKNSAHYQKLKALRQAPACDTCHVPHEFRVLNVSEFHDLCSQCHNIDMRIAPSDAPDRAIAALADADRLKSEIKKADDAIRFAKQQGKDVSTAQKNLDNAISIRDSLPVLWHSFDLSNFRNVTDSGIKYAQQAQIDSGVPMATPSSPGFGALLSIAGMIGLCLLLRRR